MADDLGNQLAIQQQINKVLQDRQAMMAANSKQMSNQLQFAVDLCKAMDCKELEDIEDRMKGIHDEMQKAADQSKELGENMTDAANQGKAAIDAQNGSLEKNNKLLTAGKGAAIGLAGGLISGFKGGIAMTKSLVGAIGNIIGSLGKVGKSILSLPFKLMGGLIGMAQGGGGGPSPIRVELENIRKEFGSLASNEGKAAASSMKQFRDQASDLAGTGVSLRKVFGAGPGGVAKAMAYNLETMKALGPAVSRFSEAFANSAVELSVFRKGLGLAGDEMAGMMKHLEAMGKDPVDGLREVTSMAFQLGDQFGVSGKLVAKSMAVMSKDVANFGTLTVKQLGTASVFARKLGIEIKDLQGLVGKFDNFEDAAQGAAKLSQAFGMNVDAMKMMKENDPAARLAMLQKSFKATGKDASQLSRQELKLLASQTGLSEEAARTAFSNKGMSMSYDDIQKAGGKAEKKQLTQAQAMDKLADSMERVFGGGGGKKFKSFFDAFVQGFARGITRSKEFRKIMRNIRKSLKVVYRGGQEIGKMFVKMFPGVQKMMKGLGDLFDPKRFRGLMKDVKGVFKQFFKDLKTDPEAGVQSFFKNITKAFKKFFKAGGTGSQQVMEGGKEFLTAFWHIFKGVLALAVEGLAKLFTLIADKLANPPKVPTALGKAFRSLGKAAGKLLGELWKVLKPPLIRAFKALFEAAKPVIKKMGIVWLKMMLTKMLIMGVASALKGAVVGKIGMMLTGMFSKVFKANPIPSPDDALPPPRPGPSRISTFLEKLGAIKIMDIAKASLKLTLLGTLFFPALVVLAIVMRVVVGIIGPNDAIAAAAAMIAIGVAIVSMKFAIDAGSQISLGKIGKAIMGLVGGAAVLVSGALVFSLALRFVSAFFKGIDWIGVGIAMIGIAVAMGAVAAMIWAASVVPKEMIVNATMNMAVASLFVLAVGLFALAMQVTAPQVMAVPWMALLPVMLPMLGVIALLIATAFISQAFAAVGIPGSIGLGHGLVFALALTAFSFALTLMSGIVATLAPQMPLFVMFAVSMALIVGALALTALAATYIIPFAIPGSLGLAGAAIFVLAAAHLLGPALKSFYEEVNSLDFKALAVAFLALALIIPAVGIMAYAAIPAGILGFVGAMFVSGIAFFVRKLADPDGLLGDLTTFSENAMKLPWKAIAASFGALALTFIAVAAMAYISIPAGVAGFVGSFFLGGVAMFINALNEPGGVIEGLATMSKKVNKIDTSVGSKLETLAQLFRIMAMAAEMSFDLIIFSLPIIGTIMNKALDKIPDFAEKVICYLEPSIKMLDQMVLTDPGGLEQKVNAIGQLMEVVGSLAGVATALAGVDTDSMPDGSSTGSTLGAAESFMTGLFEGVQGLIEVLLGTPLTPAQIQSANAMGNVLGAIGDMVKAVAPSPELMKSLRKESSSLGGLFSSSEADTEAISALADYMDSMMGAIRDQIPKIMGSIMEAVNSIPSTPGVGKKIKLVAEAFQVISVLAGAISDIMDVVPKQDDPKAQAEMLKSVIDAVNGALFGDGGNIGALKKAFDGLRDVVNAVPAGKSFAAKVPIVAEAFGILGSFASSLGAVSKLMPKEVEGSKEMGPRLKALLEPGGLMDGIVSALSGDNGMLMKIFDTLKGAIDQLPGDEGALKAMATKVEILGSMFGVVGQFASAMADIGGIIPNVEGQPPPPLDSAITFCEQIVSSLVGQGGDGMLGKLAEGLLEIVTQESTKDLYKYRRQIKGLGDAFEVIGVFAKALGDLAGLSTGEGAGSAGITSMLSNLAGAYGKGMTGNNDIVDIIGGFANIGKEAQKARLDTRSMKKGADFACALSETLTAMANMPAQIESDATKLADQMAQISSMFASAGEGSDFAIAVAVAQGLTGQKELVITHENMSINLTVNVEIEPGKFARGTISALGQVNGQPGYKTFAPMGEGG
jgi:NACalpha-BTF3-like transcription factor